MFLLWAITFGARGYFGLFGQLYLKSTWLSLQLTHFTGVFQSCLHLFVGCSPEYKPQVSFLTHVVEDPWKFRHRLHWRGWSGGGWDATARRTSPNIFMSLIINSAMTFSEVESTLTSVICWLVCLEVILQTFTTSKLRSKASSSVNSLEDAGVRCFSFDETSGLTLLFGLRGDS